MALQRLPRIGRVKALRAALSGRVPSEAGGSPSAPRMAEALEWASQEIGRSREIGAEVVTFFDKRYPPNLSKIADPPVVLYVRGNADLLASPRLVAVVGTREPSRFGVEAARALTMLLGNRGWGIVSGLARGIDTIAHRAALDTGAPTIAILGSGVDRIYPRENEGLAEAIVANGGALVSELPLGVPPLPVNLVARDRLQSGTGVAVVLAETGLKGGAMHTARFAAEQGRPVFCPVPPDADDRCAGLTALLDLPAETLCEVLPAWRSAQALCWRLGRAPLAHPVTPGTVADLFDRLEDSLDEGAPAQQTLIVPDRLD